MKIWFERVKLKSYGNLRIKISLTSKPVITAKKRDIFREKNLGFLNSNLVKTCQTKLKYHGKFCKQMSLTCKPVTVKKCTKFLQKIKL